MFLIFLGAREVFHWMRIEISSRSCVFRGRELRFGADSWKKTMFDETQVFLLVRGGLRRKILVENGILNFESVFSSFFACPRRPSAKNPGGELHSKILKVCFQVFLLVRGGLRRKVLVKNDIIFFLIAFLARNDIF